MIPDIQTPTPVLFNSLKHHIQFASELFKNYQNTDLDELLAMLEKGNNLLCDYYFGPKDVYNICEEIIDHLRKVDLLDHIQYSSWIGENTKRFKNIHISDGSEWTLLVGENQKSYVHIHPARYSRHTIRVRFLALKTAILLKLFYGQSIPNMEKINTVRKNYLRVSPIKKGGDISHILRVYSLFEKLLLSNP